MARIDELATFSEEADCLIRRFLTEELVAANTRTAEWMVAAGMRTRVDAVGNLFGRYESDPPGGRALLLGSHLDTVRNAGRFDGPLGVLAAISVVQLSLTGPCLRSAQSRCLAGRRLPSIAVPRTGPDSDDTAPVL